MKEFETNNAIQLSYDLNSLFGNKAAYLLKGYDVSSLIKAADINIIAARNEVSYFYSSHIVDLDACNFLNTRFQFHEV